MAKRQLNSRRSLYVAAALIALTILIGAGAGLSKNFGEVWLAGGAKPPPLAVTSSGNVSFGAQVDRTRVLAGGDGTVHMELVMRGERMPDGSAVDIPTDLVVAFDRSTSMAGPKLADAKAALRELLSQLDEKDRFSLVSYGSSAGVDIPLQTATTQARQRWYGIINRLEASGYTNISSALDAASQVVETHRRSDRQARVILISDGIATAGDTSDGSLVKRAQRVARGEYVLTAVGVGDDFNESLMVALADHGTGNYYYLDGSQALAAVFRDEFDSARETVATGLRVRIQPRTGVSVIDAAGYPLERAGGGVSFRPGALFSGQERRVWVTLQVPTHAAGEYDLASAALTFNDSRGRQTLRADPLPKIACVKGEGEYLAGLDKAMWERSVVKEEYGQLQMEVAESVRRGKKDAAEKAIEAYRARNQAYNRVVGSAAVDNNLVELGDLERQVNDAFAGPNQAAKQRRLSKTRGAIGWDGRRVGTKR